MSRTRHNGVHYTTESRHLSIDAVLQIASLESLVNDSSDGYTKPLYISSHSDTEKEETSKN